MPSWAAEDLVTDSEGSQDGDRVGVHSIRTDRERRIGDAIGFGPWLAGNEAQQLQGVKVSPFRSVLHRALVAISPEFEAPFYRDVPCVAYEILPVSTQLMSVGWEGALTMATGLGIASRLAALAVLLKFFDDAVASAIYGARCVADRARGYQQHLVEP